MPDSGGPLIGPEEYDVSSPVWVFSPVRIAADSIHIPFCVDSTNSSNALPLQPGFELKEGLLQRHSLPLQLHDATATVLGVNPTKWQERFIQLTPARLGYSLEPPTSPSADGPKLRRKLSFSRRDLHTTVYLSEGILQSRTPPQSRTPSPFPAKKDLTLS